MPEDNSTVSAPQTRNPGQPNPDSLVGKWQMFLAVILDPWVFVPLATAIAFGYLAWQVKNEPTSSANIRLDAFLSVTAALIMGFVGSRVEKSWQKHSEQTVLQARGHAAVRDLLLLLRMLSAARHRLARFIQETDITPSDKNTGLFHLDSETGTLSHCIDNAFNHWTDLVPEEEIRKQIKFVQKDDIDARIATIENERIAYQQLIQSVQSYATNTLAQSQAEIERLSALASEVEAARASDAEEANKRLQDLKKQAAASDTRSKAEVSQLKTRVSEMDSEISRLKSERDSHYLSVGSFSRNLLPSLSAPLSSSSGLIPQLLLGNEKKCKRCGNAIPAAEQTVWYGSGEADICNQCRWLGTIVQVPK
jgi:hypothetical protein